MTNKFRKERYITQVKSKKTGIWSFRVRCNGISKFFSEDDYLSVGQAFKSAVEFRNDILAGKIAFKNKNTKTIYDILLESYEIEVVTLKTKTNNLSLYDNHLKDYETTIDNFTPEYIQLKLNSLIEKCPQDTISRAFSLYKRINDTALIKGYTKEYIINQVKVPKSRKVQNKKDNSLISKEDFDNLCSYCEQESNTAYKRTQYPLILKVLYLTGMRPAELFALNKEDVIGKIDIYKSLGSSKNNIKVIAPCKNQTSVRTIPLTDELIELFEKATSLSPNNLIFPQEDGSLMDQRKLNYEIGHIAKKHNIKFNMYQLRHIFSTNLIVNGIDVRTVQELMGHTSKTMTISYARSDDELKINALKSIN